MTPSILLARSYRIACTPLAVLDATVVRRLPRASAPRRIADRAFGSLDLAAGRAFHDDGLLRRGADRLSGTSEAKTDRSRAAAPDPVEVTPDTSTPDTDTPDTNASDTASRSASPARAQRARTTSAKQHDAARSNQSLKTIRQRLVQTEAVAEARDHQDEQR